MTRDSIAKTDARAQARSDEPFDSDAPAFMRSGTSSPFGKLDAELPKQRISGETLAQLQTLAAREGMTLAEFVRMVLDGRAFGVDHVATVHAERVRRVVGVGE